MQKQRCVGGSIPIVADYKGHAIEMIVHWCYPLDAVGQGLPALHIIRVARKRDAGQVWQPISHPSMFDEMIWPAMNSAIYAATASKERRMVHLTDEQIVLLQMPTDMRPQ